MRNLLLYVPFVLSRLALLIFPPFSKSFHLCDLFRAFCFHFRLPCEAFPSPSLPSSSWDCLSSFCYVSRVGSFGDLQHLPAHLNNGRGVYNVILLPMGEGLAWYWYGINKTILNQKKHYKSTSTCYISALVGLDGNGLVINKQKINS